MFLLPWPATTCPHSRRSFRGLGALSGRSRTQLRPGG
jgi:hypothetical protein